eukprot:353880-Chlamydomonas_euryale.AAC.20
MSATLPNTSYKSQVTTTLPGRRSDSERLGLGPTAHARRPGMARVEVHVRRCSLDFLFGLLASGASWGGRQVVNKSPAIRMHACATRASGPGLPLLCRPGASCHGPYSHGAQVWPYLLNETDPHARLDACAYPRTLQALRASCSAPAAVAHIRVTGAVGASAPPLE